MAKKKSNISASKSDGSKPSKIKAPLKKLGRPKKRGRKKLPKKKPRKKPAKKKKGGSSEYFKVLKRLRQFYDENNVDYTEKELRDYASKLFGELKNRYRTGKDGRFRALPKFLNEFFGQDTRALEKIFKRLGIPVPEDCFLFWQLVSRMSELQITDYSEIDITLIGEKDWITGFPNEIDPAQIVRDVNLYLQRHPVKFPDGYLWFCVERTRDGYYFQLIYDDGKAEQQRGMPAEEEGAPEKQQEKQEKQEKQEEKKEKPKEEDGEEKRKKKQEADLSEVNKLGAILKALREQQDSTYDAIEKKRKLKLKTDKLESQLEEIEDQIDSILKKLKALQ